MDKVTLMVARAMGKVGKVALYADKAMDKASVMADKIVGKNAL